MGLMKETVDKYFLEEKCPYSKRSTVNMRRVAWAGGVFTALAIALLFYFGDDTTTSKDSFSGAAEVAKQGTHAAESAENRD